MTSKQDILNQIKEKLRAQVATMAAAAKKMHEAATGEEAKQEGKYDTRGLEASYLAGAQAEQSLKLADALQVFDSLRPKVFPPNSPVAQGAVVETESNGIFDYFFLTPCAGGITIPYENTQLTTLSPEAPLYQKMLDCNIGDIIEETDIIILDIF